MKKAKMNLHPCDFSAFATRMRQERVPELAIRCFEFYYQKLLSGETGLLPEREIVPVETLQDAERLAPEYAAGGEDVLERTVVLKLNGGLGTSMGLDKAKSLLSVKDDLTFLDVIARQAEQGGYVLLLMNSFATDSDSLDLLRLYPRLRRRLPLSFLQHKVPKVRRDDFCPVLFPEDPELEWCPPGHGDLFNAIRTSGVLEKLLAAGFRYLFVSNADNLGAVLDRRILGYFAAEEIPFLMEVADRTEADRKGGHVARLAGLEGRLMLRESAQCPSEDIGSFQDIQLHKYFNTNNLWVDLKALAELLPGSSDFLPLPMIRNEKTVDPADPSSTPVFQLETAMGAAISLFPGAQALRVSRDRFAPVKTCSDLLVVRSDLTQLDSNWQIVRNPERTLPPLQLDLDSRFYKFIGDLAKRFPRGVPSLLQCRSLHVRGDFIFGARVKCDGDVRLLSKRPQPVRIPDDTKLAGTREF